MEQQLAQQEEFRGRLLESFPDLILVVDLEERYTFVSSRAKDLLGFEPQDMVGKKISDVQDHSPELVALYQSVVSGKQAFGAAEYGVRHRDGSWRTMRASGSPLVDAESKISGVIVSVRDITIERKLEQQVVQSERLAAMGAMIGGVAHELNNPLTSILGVSELLQDTETNETTRKQLAMLQQQARRAAEIVQNLTYFSGTGQKQDQPGGSGRAHTQLARLFAAQEQHYGRLFKRVGRALCPGRSPPTDAGFPEPHSERRTRYPRCARQRHIKNSLGQGR
jgi:PAS domain S-box-containing protein